jgi:hypothetical protein
MSTTVPPRPAFIPSVIYKDNRAALKWLQDAFGFEASEVLTAANGDIVHAEMSHGDGVVMIGSEFAEWAASPASIGGKNTQRVHVRLDRGIDEHCARAQRERKSPWSRPISSTEIVRTWPSTTKAIIGRSRSRLEAHPAKKWRRRPGSSTRPLRDYRQSRSHARRACRPTSSARCGPAA